VSNPERRARVALSGDLPSPTECKKKGDPKCHDWEPAGKLDNPKEKDISGAKRNKATHFLKDFKVVGS